MFTRNSLATDFGNAPNRDAVDGFSAIAAALDEGLGDGPSLYGQKIVDAIAIGLGWLVLVAVILYPALQLAAIAICVGFLAGRSILRFVVSAIWPACPAQLLPSQSAKTIQLV